MKKTSIIILAFIMLICSTVACSKNVEESIIDSVEKSPYAIKNTVDNKTDNSENDSILSNTIKDEETNSQGADVGGTGGCIIHSSGYHVFPDALIEYSGKEAFIEWENGLRAKDNYECDRSTECPYPEANIYEFINYFNYPKEEFIKMYNADSSNYYNYQWDIDLLYSGTKEENDAYYREMNDNRVWEFQKANFIACKANLFLSFLERENKDDETYKMSDYSFAELVFLLNLSREEVESAISDSTKQLSGEHASVFDYNIDLIFDNKAQTIDMINNHSAFYMDLLFCGLEPRELPYE